MNCFWLLIGGAFVGGFATMDEPEVADGATCIEEVMAGLVEGGDWSTGFKDSGILYS